MKKIITIAILLAFIGCEKESAVSNLDVQGYWNVLNDTTFTSNASNSTSDLYHLFKGENAYYRLSFLKTHDFTNLNSRPRPDSLLSFYQVRGNQLQIPNPAPSFANNVPGNDLLSKTENIMLFTRFVIERRSTLTGEVTKSRTDTIRYVRVTDPAKIAYFDNYLKTYHN